MTPLQTDIQRRVLVRNSRVLSFALDRQTGPEYKGGRFSLIIHIVSAPNKVHQECPLTDPFNALTTKMGIEGTQTPGLQTSVSYSP